MSSRRSFLRAAILPLFATCVSAQETHFHTKPQEINQAGMDMNIPMPADDDPAIARALSQKALQLRNMQPMAFLKQFDYGSLDSGVRSFQLTATDVQIEVAPGVMFPAWTYNGTVPGPTLRCIEGEKIRIHFTNKGSTEHTMHFHGLHASNMDGVYEPVKPGESIVYEFTAEPAGLQLYHCHSMPASLHMNRGLYGVLIIDPVSPRPPAHELVMVINGWDTNFDSKNEFYALNGGVNFYRDNPIPLRANELVRLYLVNLTEYEPVVSFHIHANFFKLFRTGTARNADEYTDIVSLGQAERCILEFTYKTPGRYMFHPHQNRIAERGAMGDFVVT